MPVAGDGQRGGGRVERHSPDGAVAALRAAGGTGEVCLLVQRLALRVRMPGCGVQERGAGCVPGQALRRALAGSLTWGKDAGLRRLV
jgi:hypothetical protein